MKNLGTVKIETERLILRKFTLSDADDMYKNWTSDDEVMYGIINPSIFF